jgi:hypothetical protein
MRATSASPIVTPACLGRLNERLLLLVLVQEHHPHPGSVERRRVGHERALLLQHLVELPVERRARHLDVADGGDGRLVLAPPAFAGPDPSGTSRDR